MTVTKSFNYTYPNGYGYENLREGKIMELDFSKYEGHGIAIRANVDFVANKDYKYIHFCLKSDNKVNLKIEFKTEKSCGCAESAFSFEASSQEEFVLVPIPKLLSSLKEICIVALRNDNENTKASYYKIGDINIS